MKKDRKNPLVKSFGYAFEGIWACIRKERNMKIHCLAVILVTLTGTLLQISASEWCVCLLLFALGCAVSYMFSGYSGLYSAQKIMYSKLRPEFIARQSGE